MSQKNNNDALDALSKIKSLLSAAMFMTKDGKESELRFELMEVAHDTAAHVLEGCQ
ncbi:hypothetical protein [Tatumella morbirosei]|uniref:hypothetical protein n=1 Tax=Tatumella morbirosei TaxID=642227 RepID=UPI000AC16087|nr:hypothetical protein [Tatumella morbirosei]